MTQLNLMPSWIKLPDRCYGYENPQRTKDDRRKQCVCLPVNNTLFCERHRYMENYTPEQMTATKICKIYKCVNFFYPYLETDELCPNCADRKASKPVCEYIKNNGNHCNTPVSENGKYCSAHWKKYGNISDEIMATLPYCRECKSKILPGQGDSGKCDGCIEARKKTQDNAIQRRAQSQILCKAQDDSKKCLNKALENGYCGSHVRKYYIARSGEIGMKLCTYYLRGRCKNLIEITNPRNECGYCENSKHKSSCISNLLTTDIFDVPPYTLTAEWALQYLGKVLPVPQPN